jgi:hypothetical protein
MEEVTQASSGLLGWFSCHATGFNQLLWLLVQEAQMVVRTHAYTLLTLPSHIVPCTCCCPASCLQHLEKHGSAEPLLDKMLFHPVGRKPNLYCQLSPGLQEVLEKLLHPDPAQHVTPKQAAGLDYVKQAGVIICLSCCGIGGPALQATQPCQHLCHLHSALMLPCCCAAADATSSATGPALRPAHA